MPVPLQASATLQITPLLDIQHEDVAHAYCEGLLAHSQAGNRPLAVRDVVNCIQTAIARQWFDRNHDARLRRFIGFIVGEIHGKVVTAGGILHPDVSTLVTLTNRDEQHGYRAGRFWFFYEAAPSERSVTDDELLERLHEHVAESPQWDELEGVWGFNIACLFGELSGHLFPPTEQERESWEAECHWSHIAPEPLHNTIP